MSIHKQVPEFKVILIGDSGVGKTSMIIRATQDTFDEDNCTNTIGFSFQKMFKEIQGLGQLNLFIWDTAGQEMYRSMIKMYYRRVAVALIVYDVSDRNTFDSLDQWIQDVREKQQQKIGESAQGMECFYYIVGNKSDLDEDQREVSPEEGQEWVESYVEELDDDEEIDIQFMEVSAKSGINIQILFEDISKKLLLKYNKASGISKDGYLPKQALSYDFNQSQRASAQRKGQFRKQEQLVDLSVHRDGKDEKKDDSCCKSC